MSQLIELKAGNSVVFVEVDDVPGAPGLEQVAATGPIEENFNKVAEALKDVVESIESQLRALISRPDEVTLEMGAKLSGAANLWIVKGDAEAHMKLTLKWMKPKVPSPGGA